jgi:hypothetical protein
MCSKEDRRLNTSPDIARVLNGALIKVGLVRDRYRMDL